MSISTNIAVVMFMCIPLALPASSGNLLINNSKNALGVGEVLCNTSSNQIPVPAGSFDITYCGGDLMAPFEAFEYLEELAEDATESLFCEDCSGFGCYSQLYINPGHITNITLTEGNHDECAPGEQWIMTGDYAAFKTWITCSECDE